MMDPGKSAREAYRFLAGLPATLHLDQDHECTAHNLTRHGMLIIASVPPPEDPDVRVTLRSGTGDLVLNLAARVVHTDRDPDGEEHMLGMEFTAIEEADRSKLEALISRVVEGTAPAALQRLPPNAPPDEVRKALEQVPVAHRMTLASRAMPREREILIQDTNPRVIDCLARNPNLVNHEVRTILRMPTLLPQTIETVARNGRWTSNEQTVVLLATHRNVSFALADQLISKLSLEGKRLALRAPGLKGGLRAKLLQATNPARQKSRLKDRR